jgi:hypothetical protein
MFAIAPTGRGLRLTCSCVTRNPFYERLRHVFLIVALVVILFNFFSGRRSGRAARVSCDSYSRRGV